MNRLEILDELEKCAEDPIHFIRNYVYISHPIKGIIPFDLYRFQERIVTDVNDNRFAIVKKFRQAGVTTIMAAYALWTIIFEEHKNIIVVSIGDREAKAFLARVTEMYDSLPKWLRPNEMERNKSTLMLSTKSRIKSQPAGAGRGESASMLIVDEAAFIDNMREFWMAVYPTISTGGSAFLISTVNGTANLYYEIYRDAALKKNNFHVCDIHWKEHPEYTEEWSKVIRPNIGERAWLQEYECEFLGTGDTFIDRDTLSKLHTFMAKDYRPQYTNMMRVWKEPDPYHTYLMSVDVSFGRDKDKSAFHIVDVYNGEQVAEFYSNKVSVRDFAKIISDEGLKYNMAHIIVERNGLGLTLIEQLFEVLEYENLWTDEKGEFGVLLTRNNRDIILNKMEDAVRNFRIKINSERTVEELTSFIITEGGKIQAERGYNDDLVMSLALAAFALDDIVDKSPIQLQKGQRGLEKGEIPAFLSSKYSEKDAETMAEYYKWIMK